MTSNSKAPSTRLPNGHIRRSRLIKSGKPKGNVRFADNVQVKTFGDTLPGPNDDGFTSGYGAAPPHPLGLSPSKAPSGYIDEQLISTHQDLMSLLKSNYGDDVMLATPGNHIEEMMQSQQAVHPSHPPPDFASLGEMGLYGKPAHPGSGGVGLQDLNPQTTALQRHSTRNGAVSHLQSPTMKTSYQDMYGRNDYHSFESTTPLDVGNQPGSSYNPTSSQFGQPVGHGYGRRPRPVGGSLLRGHTTSKPSPSDFSKLSISGSMQGSGLPSM